ncbi:MAG: GGDEF domain-containing protein [Spirochaetes bacterium]|nr:GGDEF domain-containing protein [Spirochaetota bacterium]
MEFFSGLREYELDIIAEYSKFMAVEKGSFIFSQGARADGVYVIQEGRVGIIGVRDKESADVFVAQILSGESFGEMDFFGNAGRSASALAEEDTVLLKFPGGGFTFQRIFREHPFTSARMLYSLSGVISERIWQVNRMIYEKTAWLQDLRKQMLRDKVTGLYNQTYLKEDFINLLPDFHGSIALIMIKPDNFKYINDRFGHETGDQVLNLMAIFLQSELGEADIGARYRGDEYAAIILNADKKTAIIRATEIARAYREIDLSELLGTDNIKMTVSIGIALYPDNADNSRALVELSRQRLYRAREKGGNRIVV